jgi:hypothetical protein
METLSELKSETTLASIAQNPESSNHWLIFAVVIDVSEPVKQPESLTFVTKLKIIDPSFNYKQELKIDRLKFHKFVHINIYSNSIEECPQVRCVGDIIRLRRFRFKYSPRGELMGNDTKFANWLVYSGKKDQPLICYNYKTYNKNINRQLNMFEENRIIDMRSWIEEFFCKNSLKYIGWWNDIREVEIDPDQNEQVFDKIDLVLKCI